MPLYLFGAIDPTDSRHSPGGTRRQDAEPLMRKKRTLEMRKSMMRLIDS